MKRMKSVSWKFLTMSMVASMMAFAACSDDDEPDLSLEAGQTYTLNGGVHVKSGATLTIPAGTKIVAQYDDVVDYLLIEQGAKINANGSAENPIVMTCDREEPGAWGGLHICGYAHTNASGGVGSSEIGAASYGGDNDADNSGTLRYIRLEYTGYAFDEEHEANGVSFYGVGNGTTVEYLQAYKGSDDGFEFFGGSVNVKHMVDNNGTDFAAEPIAHPVLANVTLIGNGGEKQGVRLRAGTQVELYNALISGKALPLTVETAETENALLEDTSKLQFVAISGELDSKEGIYVNDNFATGEGNLTNQEFSFDDLYIGTVEGGTEVSDAFFDAAPYKGAVSADNNWTAGWTL